MKKRREALQKLGHSELVEHILLLEGRVRVLEQQVRRLQAANKEFVEAKVAKNPKNSSLPPSQARTAIFAYIMAFYNRNRRHSALDYATPISCAA